MLPFLSLNPFFLNNNNYYDGDANDYDDNIYSLIERNNNLFNYRNSLNNRMQRERSDINDLYSFRNK